MPAPVSRSVIAMAVIALSCPIAAKAAELPTGLFGVALGQQLHLPGDTGTAGDPPVARILSEETSQGPGLSLFFEPLDHDNDAFPFITGRIAGEETERSSFRMYVLPVLTETPSGAPPTYEPILIAWEAGVRSERAYGWAKHTCEGLAATLTAAPLIGDVPDRGIYECTFTQDTRSLTVSSMGGEKYSLSLRSDLAQSRLMQADALSRNAESAQ